MLQKLSEYNEKNTGAALYVSADDPWFFTNSLVDTAEEFEKFGGQYLFIVEVHKYPSKHKNYDWSAEKINRKARSRDCPTQFLYLMISNTDRAKASHSGCLGVYINLVKIVTARYSAPCLVAIGT